MIDNTITVGEMDLYYPFESLYPFDKFGFVDLFQLISEPYVVLIIILFYFLLCLWCDSWSMICVFSHRFASCEYVNATNAHTCELDIIIRSFQKEIFNTKRIQKGVILQDRASTKQDIFCWYLALLKWKHNRNWSHKYPNSIGAISSVAI